MPIENVFEIDVDIKQKTAIRTPTVTQNDSVVFIFRIFDEGRIYNIQGGSTFTMTSIRPDKQTVVTVGTIAGENTVQFKLGTTEIEVKGKVDSVIQVYDAAGRVSTIPFSFKVLKDPSSDYIPSEDEETLIQKVLGEGPVILADAQQATVDANAATANANEKAGLAQTAADNANTATSNSNNAATNANEKAILANTAAQGANEAKTAAEAATTRANSAADLIEGWENLRAYDNTTSYVPNNIVTYNGSTYQNIVASTGIPPSDGVNNANWIVLARKGVDGKGAVSTVNGVGPDTNGNVEIIIPDPDLSDLATKEELQSLDKEVDTEFADYAKRYGNTFVRALGNRLTMGMENACILVQGDSTGNNENEWVYRSMQWLATKFPKYNVKYRLWNDVEQDYDFPIILQQGTGAITSVNIPRAVGNFISTPHNPTQTITGDIDIAIKVIAANWNYSQVFISKFGAAGERAWALATNDAGYLYLWISNDGIANTTIYSTETLSQSINDPKWVRVTLDVDNGLGGSTITFFISDDGMSWTQFGEKVNNSGILSLHPSKAPIEIGSRGAGGSDNFGGVFFEAVVKNGINGTIVANPKIKSDSNNFIDVQGNTWTINGDHSFNTESPELIILNASTSGKTIAYSSDEIRFNLQTPIEPQLAFINYSHNEGTLISYQLQYEELCTKILNKYKNAGIICVTQNPQKSPEVNIIPHGIRNRQIAEVSARNNYGLVDVYRAFLETGNYESYVSSDGCHPNQAGCDLWRDEVVKFLLPATH